jgi:hypothetical protein
MLLRHILQSECSYHPLHVTSYDDSRQIIHDAVKEDIACRYPGVTGGLYGIRDVGETGRLGHGVPIIRYDGDFEIAADDAAFKARFNAACPRLAEFDLRRHGMCVAGGAVSAILMNDDEHRRSESSLYHDFDLFLVGHRSDQEAQDAINALGRHLAGFQQSAARAAEERVYRTQTCITFGLSNSLPIQIILRRYSTAAEVIHGFDLGSSAFLWDGARVWMTALGRLAAKYATNVLNLQARRASLESRIVRYFDRGYDIALPGLDADCLISLEGRLPYLFARLKADQQCSCHITAGDLFATRPGCDNMGHRDGEDRGPTLSAISDYSQHINYGNFRSITMRNATILGYDEIRVAGLCACAPIMQESDVPGVQRMTDVFSIQPTLDYAFVLEIAVWALGLDPAPDSQLHPRRGLRKKFHKDSRTSIPTLKKIFGVEATLAIISDYTRSGKMMDRMRIAAMVRERVDELNRRAVIPFAFMRVEENTSLTGPFPRHVLPPSQWFGDAYLPYKIGRIAVDAAICLASAGLSTYDILWILEWAYPVRMLDQVRLVRALDGIRAAVKK